RCRGDQRQGCQLTLWPRSLFGRLALLLLLVILISQATAIFLYRQDRAALLSRQFSDTKIVQLKALRAGLAAADPKSTAAALASFGDAYQARIVPDEERRFVGGPPQNPAMVELLERLKAELGPETDVRIQPRLQPDARQAPSSRRRSRAAARGRVARPAHAAGTATARHRGRHAGRCNARRNDFRHRRDGQDHRSVSRVCAR